MNKSRKNRHNLFQVLFEDQDGKPLRDDLFLTLGQAKAGFGIINESGEMEQNEGSSLSLRGYTVTKKDRKAVADYDDGTVIYDYSYDILKIHQMPIRFKKEEK